MPTKLITFLFLCCDVKLDPNAQYINKIIRFFSSFTCACPIDSYFIIISHISYNNLACIPKLIHLTHLIHLIHLIHFI
eukprot:UN04759